MTVRLDGLRLQLLGLIFLPFSAVLLIIALAGVHIHQAEMRRVLFEGDERLARMAAATVSDQAGRREGAVGTIARRIGAGEEPSVVLDESAPWIEALGLNVAVIDRAGSLVAASAVEPAWLRPEMLAGAQEPQASNPSVWVLPAKRMVLVAANAGEVVVVGGYSADVLMPADLLAPIVAGESGFAVLVGSDGQLLAGMGSVPQPAALARHVGMSQALTGGSGAMTIDGADGEHVAAYATVEPYGWVLLLEKPWQHEAGRLLDASLAAPLVLVPAFVVTLVALWFGARQVVEPLRRLEQLAERLAREGDPVDLERPVGGIAEVRHLQATLASMARRVSSAHQALRGYIGAISRAQEDERRRLARELHDQTIQDLIALDQRIQMLGMRLKSAGSIEPEQVEDLHRAANEAIQEVRRLSRALRPIYLEDLGLVPALEMLARETQTALAIPVGFQARGVPQRLPSEAELTVYRIVQEALSNVGRHAQARHAWVEVEYQPEALTAQVRDDGVGFQPPERTSDLALQGHYGILGMYERAERVGARLSIASSPGEGTRVSLHLVWSRGE